MKTAMKIFTTADIRKCLIKNKTGPFSETWSLNNHKIINNIKTGALLQAIIFLVFLCLLYVIIYFSFFYIILLLFCSCLLYCYVAFIK